MKLNILKYAMLAFLTAGLAVGCSDDGTELAEYRPILMGEDFNVGADNTVLETAGWINYASAGTAKWEIQRYSGNGYAEFSAFNSEEVSNIGWLISPKFVLTEDNLEVLRFQASQSFVSSPANKLEILISTNFDGTNVEAATWTPLSGNLPGIDEEYFLFVDSGEIPLGAFSGDAYIAFKVTGGNDNALDGSYQIDNVRVYK